LDSNIGVDGENAIAEGLKRIMRLEELDLHDDNDFRDKQGATAIAKALMDLWVQCPFARDASE